MMDMRCKTCKHYEKSNSSIFGGWCLLGCHLHDNIDTRSGISPDDHCFDWEAKNGTQTTF